MECLNNMTLPVWLLFLISSSVGGVHLTIDTTKPQIYPGINGQTSSSELQVNLQLLGIQLENNSTPPHKLEPPLDIVSGLEDFIGDNTRVKILRTTNVGVKAALSAPRQNNDRYTHLLAESPGTTRRVSFWGEQGIISTGPFIGSARNSRYVPTVLGQVLHRPKSTRYRQDQSTARNNQRTYVILPGQHDNMSPHPILHRVGDSTHVHGRRRNHVNLPREHRNDSPYTVIHRKGQPVSHVLSARRTLPEVISQTHRLLPEVISETQRLLSEMRSDTQMFLPEMISGTHRLLPEMIGETQRLMPEKISQSRNGITSRDHGHVIQRYIPASAADSVFSFPRFSEISTYQSLNSGTLPQYRTFAHSTGLSVTNAQKPLSTVPAFVESRVPITREFIQTAVPSNTAPRMFGVSQGDMVSKAPTIRQVGAHSSSYYVPIPPFRPSVPVRLSPFMRNRKLIDKREYVF